MRIDSEISKYRRYEKMKVCRPTISNTISLLSLCLLAVIVLPAFSYASCPNYEPFPNYSGHCDTEAEAVDAVSAFCAAWDQKFPISCHCSYTVNPPTANSLGVVVYIGKYYPQCDVEVLTPGFTFGSVCPDPTDPCCINPDDKCCKDPDPCCGTPADQCCLR